MSEDQEVYVVDMAGGKGSANFMKNKTPPMGTSDGHMIVETKKQPQTSSPQLTLFAAVSPVKISAWRASVVDWQANGADYGANSIASLVSALPVFVSSRMCLACYPATMERICELSFAGWRTWGMGGPTGFSTANISEFPSAVVASSFSDILETNVPQKYFLSPKACRGVLRRAEKHGKKLPIALKTALEHRAAQEPIGREDHIQP